MSDPNETDLPEPADTAAEPDESFDEKQSLLDRFRNTGVGVEDPNIVGDPAPGDAAPGRDPDPAPPGS